MRPLPRSNDLYHILPEHRCHHTAHSRTASKPQIMQKQGSGGSNIKSKKEHIEKGNYRPSRHNNRLENGVKPLETTPKAPQHLDKRHRAKWDEVCRKVFALGILTEQDLDLIEIYVTNWCMWQDAAAGVKENGRHTLTSDGWYKNPDVAIMEQTWKVINQIASLFGFSPRSRMGIKTDPPKPSDPLDDFNEN